MSNPNENDKFMYIYVYALTCENHGNHGKLKD